MNRVFQEKDLSLGLLFLEQILHDVLVGRSQPMIHLDIQEDLTKITILPQIISNLARGLAELRTTRTPINLPFHVQELFLRIFC